MHDRDDTIGLNELVSGNISDSQYITYMTSKYEERRKVGALQVYLPLEDANCNRVTLR